MKLSQNMLKMKLNAANRKQLVHVILKDALQGRSDALRAEMIKLMEDMRERTFGKTPQARAANRKKMTEFDTLRSHLTGKGIRIPSDRVGALRSRLHLNLAGEAHNIHFKTGYGYGHTVNFYNEFQSDTAHGCGEHTRRTVDVDLGHYSLTLESGDPLIKRFYKLKCEAEEIQAASSELELTITPMLKSTTLEKALDKWAMLEEYAPLIMSQSKEIIVRPDVLNARIKALKSGKGSVKSAITKGVE